MERLTERTKSGKATLKGYGTVLAYEQAIDRLAYYEDMEEQGGLVVLPCKVGDIVYAIDGEYEDWIDEYEVKYFYCSSSGIDRIYATCGTLSKNFRPKQFGKTVFLTREEAEQALKGGAN